MGNAAAAEVRDNAKERKRTQRSREHDPEYDPEAWEKERALRETERKRKDAERKRLERARNSASAQRSEAIELDPKSVKQCRRKKPSILEVEAPITEGNILRAKGDLDGAEQCFRKSISLGPKHPGAYWNLGCVLKARHDFQGAAHCFRRAHGLDPRDPDHLIELGCALLNKGDFRGAKNSLLQALELIPKYHFKMIREGRGLRKVQTNEIRTNYTSKCDDLQRLLAISAQREKKEEEEGSRDADDDDDDDVVQVNRRVERAPQSVCEWPSNLSDDPAVKEAAEKERLAQTARRNTTGLTPMLKGLSGPEEARGSDFGIFVL